MPTVFVLEHVYEWCGHDEVKTIGVYASEADAAEAMERLRKQPGFRDWPAGFSIDPYELGVDHWVEGFVTVVLVLVPSKGDADAFQICQAVWRPGNLYELGELDDPKSAMFAHGDIVRAEERSLPGHGERALVVTERVREGA